MKRYIVLSRGDDGWVEPYICRGYEEANQKVYDLYSDVLRVNITEDPNDDYSIERLNELNEKTDRGRSPYTAEFVSRQIDRDGVLVDGVWFEVYSVHTDRPGFRIH